MFERFTTEAREVVTSSQAQARRLCHQRVDTEHLLLAMLRPAEPDTIAGRVLGTHGLSAPDVEAAIARFVTADPGLDGLDAEALRSIGIDLDAVREKVEDAFGPGALDGRPGDRRRWGGHIPFSPRAKKVFELSLREAVRLKHRTITDGHLLLGLLREGGGLASKIIADAGIGTTDLRAQLERELH